MIANPIEFVMGSVAKADSSDGYIRDIRIKNHLALEAVLGSAATAADLALLAHTLHMSQALEAQRVSQGWGKDLSAGRAAVDAYALTGTMTDAQKSALLHAIAIHDAQLDHATVGNIERGLKYKERVTYGLQTRH